MDHYSEMAKTVNSTGRWSSSLNDSNFTDAQKMDALNQLDNRMTIAVLPATILVAIETVVGFFGNIIVLYVFLFHYKRCNFRWFVLCLGVIDLISTVTTMPWEAVSLLYWYTFPDPIFCRIKSYSNVFTMTAESLVLLSITTDRYLKACRPLGRQMSVKTTRCIVIGIFMFASIISIPGLFFVRTHRTELIYQGVPVTVTTCQTDRNLIGGPELEAYSFARKGILCASMAAMFVMCVLIMRRLLCRKNEISSRSTPQPTPKMAVSYASNIANKEQLSIHSIEVVEDVHARGVSPSDDISDLKSDSLGVGRMTISDDNLSTSTVEGIRVERKVEGRTEPGHVHKNYHITQRSKRVRHKTIIMLVLTVTYIVTSMLYLTLIYFISKGILQELSDAERATCFFFLRLYLINHAINPIIYGVLDPQFKKVISQCRPFRREQSNSNC